MVAARPRGGDEVDREGISGGDPGTKIGELILLRLRAFAAADDLLRPRFSPRLDAREIFTTSGPAASRSFEAQT